MRKFALFGAAILLAGGAAISVAVAQVNGSAPDPTTLYQHRADCHIAYDYLIEQLDEGQSVSAEEEAWAMAHETAGNEGRPCAAPSEELALKAQDRAISTSDGARAARSYIDKQGDPVAMLELGLGMYSGFFSDATQQDGLALVRQAAEKGDPMAGYLHGMFLIQGVYGSQDFRKGMPFLQRAAESGNIDAMFRYGVFLKEGMGIKKDLKKAFEQFSRAAENGHTYAAVVAFEMASEGQGTKKDFALAYRLGRNLAAKGEVYGAVMAASALLQGKDALEHEDEILYWTDMAIANGDDTIRSQMSPIREQVVELFSRTSAPAGYSPAPRRACPIKTTCTVNHFSGLQSCTTGKDFWSDCDG